MESPGSRDFEEILQYINDQITPHLRDVLKAVGETRPADPIQFIASSFINGGIPDSDAGASVVHEESLAGYLGRHQVVTIVQQAVGACAAMVPPPNKPLEYVGEYLRNGSGAGGAAAAAPEPEQAPTDTIWAGGIPLNLVGGEAALSSVLNLDANTNVTSLFEQFGEVRHSTVRVKPGVNKSWALVTFKDIENSQRCLQEGITVMDANYEEIQLRLSYSDVEGQLQKNPTGTLAKMASKHAADLAPPESDTAWIGGIPDGFCKGDIDEVNKTFAENCKQFGEVISATVRVKPGVNKSWALCTFKEPASARKCVSEGMTLPDGDGSQMSMKCKISDVDSNLKKGTTGALASMAKKHEVGKKGKKQPALANLAVRQVNEAQAAKSTGRFATVMQKHMPARMRGTMAARVAECKNPEQQTEVSREVFVQWWISHIRGLRRKLQMESLKIFDELDKETAGALDKKALIALVKVCRNQPEYKSGANTTAFESTADYRRAWWSMGSSKASTRPALNLETVFESIDKRKDDRVSRSEWEEWFSEHIGYDGADLPLLPEYMARKIEATAEQQSRGDSQVETQAGGRQKKTGAALWRFLRTRLRVLVSFQSVWGTSHDIYPNMDSLAEDEGPLPAGIIDPDAAFAVWWNLVQIVALVYVAVFVPIRVAWANEPAPFSSVWFIELLIDLYFLADVAVNFRSAYYDDVSGTRITNSAEITSRYFRGWFIIDVLGILPISYIGLIINGIPKESDDIKESDDTKQTGSDIKALKVLRLFRLAKMLRLRKLKQLLKQYEDNGLDVNIMVETAMTLVIIALMAHVLACMYYFIGTINEVNNNREVLGWVENPETRLDWHWWQTQDGGPSVGTQYVAAISMGMRQEWLFTDNERMFSVFASLVVALIYGAIDALIVTSFMTMNAGDQARAQHESALKAWMRARHLDRPMQALILNNFISRYKNRGIFDEKEIKNSLPPQLQLKVAVGQYFTHIAQAPFFMDLGFECMAMLCSAVEHLDVSKETSIFEEGDMGTVPLLAIADPGNCSWAARDILHTASLWDIFFGPG